VQYGLVFTWIIAPYIAHKYGSGIEGGGQMEAKEREVGIPIPTENDIDETMHLSAVVESNTKELDKVYAPIYTQLNH
jgi:hypothetical protein